MKSDARRSIFYRPEWVLLLTWSVIAGVSILVRYAPFTFLDADPGWTATATISLIDDWDLDLKNQLSEKISEAQDQTARGVHGEWYPLHEIGPAFLAIPFYVIFGVNGFLALNFFVSALLVLCLFQIARHAASRSSAWVAALLIASTSIILHYSYSFSADLIGTFLVAASLQAALYGRGFLSGFLAGSLLLFRLPYAACIPGIFVLAAMRKNSWRFCFGVVPWTGVFFLSNAMLFGSPLTTAFRYWQVPSADGSSLELNALSFRRPILEGVIENFFSLKRGLLTGSPILIPAFLFGTSLWWRQSRAEFLGCLLVVLLLIALVLPFHGYPGVPGNRYLMPIIVIAVIPLGLLIEEVRRRCS